MSGRWWSRRRCWRRRFFSPQVNENDRLWGEDIDSTLTSPGLLDGSDDPLSLSVLLLLSWMTSVLLLLLSDFWRRCGANIHSSGTEDKRTYRHEDRAISMCQSTEGAVLTVSPDPNSITKSHFYHFLLWVSGSRCVVLCCTALSWTFRTSSRERRRWRRSCCLGGGGGNKMTKRRKKWRKKQESGRPNRRKEKGRTGNRKSTSSFVASQT